MRGHAKKVNFPSKYRKSSDLILNVFYLLGWVCEDFSKMRRLLIPLTVFRLRMTLSATAHTAYGAEVSKSESMSLSTYSYIENASAEKLAWIGTYATRYLR